MDYFLFGVQPITIIAIIYSFLSETTGGGGIGIGVWGGGDADILLTVIGPDPFEKNIINH